MSKNKTTREILIDFLKWLEPYKIKEYPIDDSCYVDEYLSNQVEKPVMPPCNNECLVKNNNGIQCGAISKRGYHCSRLPDYKGDHVACAVECGIDVWSA